MLLILLLTIVVNVAGAEVPDQEESGSGLSGESIPLSLIPRRKTTFTNVLLHYVYFDAEFHQAEKLTVRVLDPEGNYVAFRTRKHVDNGLRAVQRAGYNVKKGQKKLEGLNVLFQSNLTPGTWNIEVTVSSATLGEITEKLPVEILEAQPLKLNCLGEAHAMIDGMDGGDVIGVEKGRIRYICQDPKDPSFIKWYWLSPAFDLREIANTKCTRADFSMALSWLGIDCTPIRMSELVMTREIYYTYDPVCKKLGNVERITGDLETLWREYQAGEASPVLIHFTYGENMHAMLLILRDEENPELFYAVNTGTRINTSDFPDGRSRDAVVQILIEEGKTGQRIHCPLLKKYHKAVIDQIWQWKVTEMTTDESANQE